MPIGIGVESSDDEVARNLVHNTTARSRYHGELAESSLRAFKEMPQGQVPGSPRGKLQLFAHYSLDSMIQTTTSLHNIMFTRVCGTHESTRRDTGVRRMRYKYSSFAAADLADDYTACSLSSATSSEL